MIVLQKLPNSNCLKTVTEINPSRSKKFLLSDKEDTIIDWEKRLSKLTFQQTTNIIDTFIPGVSAWESKEIDHVWIRGFIFRTRSTFAARRERGDSPTPSQGTTLGLQLLGISANPGPARGDEFGKVLECLEIEVGAVEVSVVAFSKITFFLFPSL